MPCSMRLDVDVVDGPSKATPRTTYLKPVAFITHREHAAKGGVEEGSRPTSADHTPWPAG
jgi:hypothetical protein